MDMAIPRDNETGSSDTLKMANARDRQNLLLMSSNSTIISAVYLLAAVLLVREEEGVDDDLIDSVVDSVVDSAGGDAERVNLTSANLVASELLEGPDAEFQELFCMPKDTFHALCSWFEEHTSLRGSRYQRLEHKVMVFLWICTHDKSQRAAAQFFRASQSSVSVTFRHVLGAVRQLHAVLQGDSDDQDLDPLWELEEKLGAILEEQDADGKMAK